MTVVLIVLAVALLAAVLAVLWLLSGPLGRLAGMDREVRLLGDRIAGLEQNQGNTSTNLLTAASALQREITAARVGLAELQTRAQERAQLDQTMADSVRRLETIIAGTQSKGAAGENILEFVFSKLPPDWQLREYRVGNKVVEFALRLPNGRVLPIDSKWPATGLLEQFVGCDDVEMQARLKAQIEAVVVSKAKEVQKYLHPEYTLNFGIAAVPDAVYDLCSAVQVDCFFDHKVVLVAYSMFIPYLLLVFQTVLTTSQSVDLERLDAHLDNIATHLRAIQEEVEGRLSRGLTMTQNSRDDLRLHIGTIQSSLSSLQSDARRAAPLADEPIFPPGGPDYLDASEHPVLS